MRPFLKRSVFAFLFGLCFISGSGQSAFNVNQPDLERLNTLVIEKINQMRTKRKALPLEFSRPLHQTAIYFTHSFKAGKLDRLRSDRKKYLRKADVISYKYGYANNLLDVVITTATAVDYKGGSFYFDKKDTETNNHLFYGQRPTKKEREEPDFKLVAVDDLTYEALADKMADLFLRDSRSLKCLNAGYTLVGCSCKLEERTLNRSKLPIVKAVFVLGGRRINF